MTADYIGRFAPSPTGPLHAGSLVAALASWLDARAHGGRWLVRIEDVDQARCLPGADQFILQQLALCGLHPDEAPVHQSARGALYQRVLDALAQRARAYPCLCSRREVEQTLEQLGRARNRHGELVYPGTCRPGPGKAPVQGCDANGSHLRAHDTDVAVPRASATRLVPAARPCAWRMRVPAGVLLWQDRRLGAQAQDVAAEVGDFVLKRADGYWAYQLAVTVDDVAQGVTHIVRGEDLADNTPRQILLLHALGYPTPAYLHTPLVLGPNGEKLSKQNGAQALDLGSPDAVLAALKAAAAALGLAADTHAQTRGDVASAQAAWVAEWRARWARR
ncbi:tRNA glutamyl-Q(34) synthetase GluQRS [Hylemonella gracilis]|uniref:Glutamyl-Q tRNA(Asp) synthetase n=1 Tax=Hylemonella gracilis TaxID=80880 RepID=A0A4P6UNM9_9BURK|nr:tRNA glutamyl-Q(34) synthetase GluQRS [Hylemonella gracilis]QBK05697.1 tRNA glutamyl-Q(34) synthetase GluQRS [Hylemonella gracilis]